MYATHAKIVLNFDVKKFQEEKAWRLTQSHMKRRRGTYCSSEDMPFETLVSGSQYYQSSEKYFSPVFRSLQDRISASSLIPKTTFGDLLNVVYDTFHGEVAMCHEANRGLRHPLVDGAVWSTREEVATQHEAARYSYEPKLLF